MGLESLKNTTWKKNPNSVGSKPHCLQAQMGRASHMEGLERTVSSWRKEIFKLYPDNIKHG